MISLSLGNRPFRDRFLLYLLHIDARTIVAHLDNNIVAFLVSIKENGTDFLLS